MTSYPMNFERSERVPAAGLFVGLRTIETGPKAPECFTEDDRKFITKLRATAAISMEVVLHEYEKDCLVSLLARSNPNLDELNDKVRVTDLSDKLMRLCAGEPGSDVINAYMTFALMILQKAGHTPEVLHRVVDETKYVLMPKTMN